MSKLELMNAKGTRVLLREDKIPRLEIMGILREELIDNIEIGGVATYLGKARESAINLFI